MSKVKVEVFEQLYTISTDADPQYVTELARYVDTKMKEIASTSRTLVSTNKIAVLAAIHIANDLVSLQKEIKENEVVLSKKMEEMLHELNKSLDKLPDGSPNLSI